MKSFAHRGWSAGKGENTIEAFKKSAEAGIDGIELDIRHGVDGKTIVVIHNRATDNEVLSLEEALLYLKSTTLELLIEFKKYSDEFYTLVVDLIEKHGMQERVIFFAFPHIASKFPWHKPRSVKLGIIAILPRHIGRYRSTYNPDIILLGWGDRVQRFVFKTFWSISSLPKVIKTNDGVKFVVGVAYNKRDIHWISKQTNVYGFTVDNPNVRLGD